MLNLYILASIFIAVLIVIFGLLVFTRNAYASLNRLFFVFSLFAAIWLVSNYLSGSVDIAKQLALVSNHITLASGGGMLLFLSLFIKQLTNRKTSFVWKLFIVCGIGVNLLALSPLVIKSISVAEGTYVIQFGIFAAPYFLFLLLACVVTLFNLILSKKTTSQSEKQRVNAILKSLAVTAVAIMTTNAILPFFFNNFSLTNAGSYFIVILVGGLGYAVAKHKLFDVRFVVFRSLGYILSLVTIAIIAFITLSSLTVILDRYSLATTVQRTIFVALTLILATSYQPFKILFDRLTRKLFYRDAYDTQALLNDFNETIVSTIDLTQLLKRSALTIENYMKPDFCEFAIRDSQTDTIRLISNGETATSKEAVEQIRAYAHNYSEKLIVTDVLEEGMADLKQLLQKEGIGLLIRITSDSTVEGTGYIVMGYKKSGNVYNSQDTSVIEILANELAIAIQNALQFEEIQKFTVTLQEKVDDATKRLRRSNEKLKQMDETKDEFISMASHQLRTPLTSVKGYVSMVIEGDAGELNEMQKKLLDQAFVSSQRMVYLIADLLNVSRLRTGKFIIDAVPSNLAEVIQGEVDQLVETAASRGLELSYDKPVDFPRLLLDETKVRQVIMNFIDNAIYYTPTGGHIKVALKDTGSTIEYTVTDDGLGVPKGQQHHLFSKFFRADNAKKARPDGTGLGLFMAKKVIVAQGGSLIFKSTEGKGSTFGFVFSKEKLGIPEGFEAPAPLNGIKSGPGATAKR